VTAGAQVLASLASISISAFQNLYSWFLLDSFLGGVLEVAHKWGNVVLVVVSLSGAWHVLGQVTHHTLEGFVLLGANLGDDLGDHVLELLGLAIAGHDKKVLAHGKLDHGLAEVDNSGVILEHVDLIDVIEGLDTELLDGAGELLVNSDGGLGGVDLLGSSLGALATELGLSAKSLREPGTCVLYFLIHLHS